MLILIIYLILWCTLKAAHISDEEDIILQNKIDKE